MPLDTYLGCWAGAVAVKDGQSTRMAAADPQVTIGLPRFRRGLGKVTTDS
jgi:hypothetical protein